MKATNNNKNTSKYNWNRSKQLQESIVNVESRQSLGQRNRRIGELVRKAIELYKQETNQPNLTDLEAVKALEVQSGVVYYKGDN